MSYPYNPNLSFKPSTVDHYVAFDSKLVSEQNKYTIRFEQAYRNVVSVSLVSACLPVNNSYDYVSLKINNLENIQSGNVIGANGNLDNVAALDHTFAMFYFTDADSSNSRKIFMESDIVPNKMELQTPIAKLAHLDMKWQKTNFVNDNIDDGAVLNSWYVTSSCVDSDKINQDVFETNKTYYSPQVAYKIEKTYRLFYEIVTTDSISKQKYTTRYPVIGNKTLSQAKSDEAEDVKWVDDSIIKYNYHNISTNVVFVNNSVTESDVNNTHTLVFKITTCS